jgi:hypothetical protein
MRKAPGMVQLFESIRRLEVDKDPTNDLQALIEALRRGTEAGSFARFTELRQGESLGNCWTS